MQPNGIYFNADEAQFHCDFIETLTLTKSTQSGRPERFKLLPPHRKLVANVHGWRRADGARLIRRVYFSVARKNAKTQIAAAMALDLLVADSEASPEIYVAAKDREQASICFRAAAAMVQASEELSDMLKVTKYQKSIENPANGGIFQALSSEGGQQHGKNPSTLIIDELHAWGPPEQELYDALTSGSRARRQPLTIIITTAGVDEYTLCGREYERACRVRDKLTVDPTYLPMIYELPKDADWTDETLWSIPNPTLGKIVRLEELRNDFRTALERPSEQTSFRRLAMNQWVNAKNIWIPLMHWDACCLNDSDPMLATAG